MAKYDLRGTLCVCCVCVVLCCAVLCCVVLCCVVRVCVWVCVCEWWVGVCVRVRQHALRDRSVPCRHAHRALTGRDQRGGE